MTLDDLRARFPALGFGLYAFERERPVQLEVHMPSGDFITLEDWTVAGVVGKVAEYLIPPAPPPQPEPEEDIFG